LSEKAYALDLTVPPEDIYYISWNIDACEGLGILETISAREGKVTVYTTAAMLPHLYSFVEGLSKEGVAVNICDLRVEGEQQDDV
jgi:hypothetical protein